ncbi:hypothetical protein L7F22_016656 [Adiantum nelumboides]|nr:hypothetical protein [Adiantum nelumboides]
MTANEQVEGGFPKTFDNTIYNILESKFAVDILVDPGLILVDSTVEVLENLNSTTARGGTSSVFSGPVSSPPAMGNTL